MHSADRRELSEAEAFEIALSDHPEYAGPLARGNLPHEIVDEHGNLMSPRLHLTMHAVVERQLAADDPKGVVAIASELDSLGFSAHDIRHEIASVLAEEMHTMLSGGQVFDEARYLAKLRAAVEAARRNGGPAR
ncbi:MAG: DUF1841 family protein [Thermoguttaceae bacterium]|jgi:hypothetical protein|nr:DUF1841 family protein [Thermoguttaceae bacterium]